MIDLTTCSSCGTAGLPTTEGHCPNCGNPGSNAAIAATGPTPDRPQSIKQALEAIYAYGADLMANGLRPIQVENRLAEKGLSADGARQVVSQLCRVKKKALRSAAARNMLLGLLWCFGGLAFTMLTYEHARSQAGGGKYVVAYGAVIAGACQFLSGLKQGLQSLA